MAPLVLADIEAVMQLCVKHDCEEYSSEHFTIKRKAGRAGVKAEPTAAMLLEKHLAPLPDAPWDSVPQETADKWVEKVST